MRLKVAGPSGFNKVIKLEDHDTLRALISATASPFPVLGIRYGYPPQTINITEEDLDQTVESLGISPGEKITLITVPDKITNAGSMPSEIRNNATDDELPVTQTRIVLPEGQKRILQVHTVPDDNSCLFHSISYCIYKDISLSGGLRKIVSEEIRADPLLYSDAVLDRPNKEYAQWILQKDSWGGGIEIAILSKKLGVAIYVLDIDAQQFERFNEDQFDQFIVVMFSGVHYDSVELDDAKTVFDKRDEYLSQLILSGTLKIAQQMKKGGHSFNTSKDKIICNVCKKVMVGEKAVAKHAEGTGHVDFGQSSN